MFSYSSTSQIPRYVCRDAQSAPLCLRKFVLMMEKLSNQIRLLVTTRVSSNDVKHTCPTHCSLMCQEDTPPFRLHLSWIACSIFQHFAFQFQNFSSLRCKDGECLSTFSLVTDCELSMYPARHRTNSFRPEDLLLFYKVSELRNACLCILSRSPSSVDFGCNL
jgi:hypothetical protein